MLFALQFFYAIYLFVVPGYVVGSLNLVSALFGLYGMSTLDLKVLKMTLVFYSALQLVIFIWAIVDLVTVDQLIDKQYQNDPDRAATFKQVAASMYVTMMVGAAVVGLIVGNRLLAMIRYIK